MDLILTPQSLSLVGNMNHVVISTDTDVSFVLTLAGSDVPVIQHTYSPNDQNRIEIDLKNIILPLLSFRLQDISTPYQQTTIVRSFQFTVTEIHPEGQTANSPNDQTTCTFSVIRAGVDRFDGDVASFLQQNFLTWQPNLKPVTYYTPEFLTYYNPSQAPVSVVCKAYFSEGSGSDDPSSNDQTTNSPNDQITLAQIPASQAWTVPVQYAVIAGLCDDLPVYYDVWVQDLEGQRLTYIQRYVASDMRSQEEEWILFENSLGGIDTFRAYGDSENTAEHTHNVAEIEENYTEYRVDTTRKFRKNTGFLGKKERLWMLDFFPSLAKYTYIGSSLRRIVVIDSDVNYRAKELPSAYNFTYKYADARPYLNLPRADLPQNVLHISVPDIGDFTVAPRLVEFPRAQLSGGALFPVQNPYSESWSATTIEAVLEYLIQRIGTDYSGGGGVGHSHPNISLLNALSLVGLYLMADNRKIYAGFADEAGKLDDDSADWDKILRKDIPDTAQALITFLQGIAFGDGTYGIDGNGIGTLLSLILDSLTGSSYTGSELVGDKGFRLWQDRDGYGHLDIDYLTARVKAYFAELEIRKVTFTQGDLFFSKAGSKIVAVMPVDAQGNVLTPTQGTLNLFSSNGLFFSAASGWYAINTTDAYSDSELRSMIHAFRCYELSDDGTTATINLWQVGDMARCQTFNIKEGKYSGVSNRYYGRLVVGCGTEQLADGLDYNYVDLYIGWDEDGSGGLTLVYEDYDESKQIFPYGYGTSHQNPYFMGISDAPPQGHLANDLPAVGDDIAQVGNQSDAERMNLIRLALSEGGSIDIFSGVLDWDLPSHRVVKISPSGVEVEARYFLLKSNSGAGTPVPVTVFRGEWSSSTTYGYYDEVTYNGSLYVWNNSSANSTSSDVPGVSQYWLLAVSKGDTGDLPTAAEIRADSTAISISADNNARISDLSSVYGLPSSFSVYYGNNVIPTSDISYIDVNGKIIKGSGVSVMKELQPKNGRYAINQNDVTISQWQLNNTTLDDDILAPTAPIYINATFTVDGETKNAQLLIPITVTKAGSPAISVELTPPVIIVEEKTDGIDYNGAVSEIKVIEGSEEISAFSAAISSASAGVSVNQIDINPTTHIISLTPGTITSTTLTNAMIIVSVTVRGTTYDIPLSIYVNRLGSWKMSVENDVMTSISTREMTFVDENGNPITTTQMTEIFQNAARIELNGDLIEFKDVNGNVYMTLSSDGSKAVVDGEYFRIQNLEAHDINITGKSVFRGFLMRDKYVIKAGLKENGGDWLQDELTGDYYLPDLTSFGSWVEIPEGMTAPDGSLPDIDIYLPHLPRINGEHEVWVDDETGYVDIDDITPQQWKTYTDRVISFVGAKLMITNNSSIRLWANTLLQNYNKTDPAIHKILLQFNSFECKTEHINAFGYNDMAVYWELAQGSVPDVHDVINTTN